MTNTRDCVHCGRMFIPRHMNTTVCSDECRRIRNSTGLKATYKEKVQREGELRHERLLKLYGTPKHQQAPPKKKGGKHNEPNSIKGHTQQSRRLINKQNYTTLIDMLNEKPYTTGQIWNSKKLVDVRARPLGKGAIRHYLRNLVSVGLLKQKVSRMGTMNEGYRTKPVSGYSFVEVWIYTKPVLKTPMEQLFYLSKIDVLKQRGIHVCKHTFM